MLFQVAVCLLFQAHPINILLIQVTTKMEQYLKQFKIIKKHQHRLLKTIDRLNRWKQILRVHSMKTVKKPLKKQLSINLIFIKKEFRLIQMWQMNIITILVMNSRLILRQNEWNQHYPIVQRIQETHWAKQLFQRINEDQ